MNEIVQQSKEKEPQPNIILTWFMRETRLWPSAETQVCPHALLRGLSWQPFNPHILCPLALEQNSHHKVFLLPKAFHLPGPLLSLGKYGGACETYMSEQGSLVPPLSPNEFWTFIYYLYMLYFKQASSLQLWSQCLWHPRLGRLFIYFNLKTTVYLTVSRGHLFPTFMQG